MVTQKQIKDFFLDKRLAVVGAPRDSKKFGAYVCRELKNKGFSLYLVNPATDEINGEKCYRSVNELSPDVKAALLVTPSSVTADVLKEVISSPIEHIWIQQSSDSPEALRLAIKSGKNIISKKCIMMFAEPVKGAHSFHRFFVKLFGAYPKA